MKTKISLVLILLSFSIALAQAAPQAALTVAVYDFKGDADAAKSGADKSSQINAVDALAE